MKKSNHFSPEVREPAVRIVQEHRGEYPPLWAAIESIVPKIGCAAYPQRMGQAPEIDTGARACVTTTDLQRLKELERENKDPRQANEILKLARRF